MHTHRYTHTQVIKNVERTRDVHIHKKHIPGREKIACSKARMQNTLRILKKHKQTNVYGEESQDELIGNEIRVVDEIKFYRLSNVFY